MKGITGTRIRELRRQLNITQSELAKKLGVSPSTIGMYEQGRRKPDNETLLELCGIFDTTTDYLLGKSNIYCVEKRNREVSEVIDEFTRILSSQQGLMFDGTPINDDDRRKIVDAIKVAAAIAQQQYKTSYEHN